jgi:hypothetical protein
MTQQILERKKKTGSLQLKLAEEEAPAYLNLLNTSFPLSYSNPLFMMALATFEASPNCGGKRPISEPTVRIFLANSLRSKPI